MMEIYSKVSEMRLRLGGKGKNITTGFVPTMGALHRGHLSLVELCKSMSDLTVVSIFVNPTQFNDKDDYRRYPRNPETDCGMLEEAGCDIVFMPTESEIYPEPDNRIFDFGMLDKVMEGAFRPGHFNGVAQVVSRLFEIVQPDKSFFGQKDFQQVAIIKAMVEQLSMGTEIVVAPIVREDNGLAMSSRNVLLTDVQRKHAACISRWLYEGQTIAKQGQMSPEYLKNLIYGNINVEPEMKSEYVEIVDGDTLMPVYEWSGSETVFACVAARAGKIRLIDNMRLK